MSDVNDESRRARRRAVRTAGPPVDEPGVAQPAPPARAGNGARPVTDSGVTAPAETASAANAPEQASTKKTPPTKTVPKKTVPTKSTPTKSTVEKTTLTKAAAEEEAAAEKAGGTADAATEKHAVASTAAAPPTLEKKATATDGTAESAAGAGSAGVESSGAGGGRFVLRRVLVAAAAAVLVAALLAGAVVSVFTVRSIDQRADRRTAYVQTAEQAILNLTTIRADTAKEDIDRILSLASGKFKTEFDGRVDPFLSIVQQAEVRANGEIIEAALESDAENSAKVLVAAKQVLTNAGQEGPQTRYYRFRVTVSESDSGLTASNVEFVP